MQPNDAPDPATATGPPPKSPGLWKRVQAWDGQLSVTKGLTIVTLLTGFFTGYFQYLNAYEDKVREQAKTDMASATSTFLDITNAFAEAEMLQQLIYFDYAATLNAGVDAGNSKMVTQAGQGFSRITQRRGPRCARTAAFLRARPKSISTGPATHIAIRPRHRFRTRIR